MLQPRIENVCDYVSQADPSDVLSTITVSNYKDSADIDLTQFRAYNQHLRKIVEPELPDEVISLVEAAYTPPAIESAPEPKVKYSMNIKDLPAKKQYILFKLLELILHSPHEHYSTTELYNFYRMLAVDKNDSRISQILHCFSCVAPYDVQFYAARATTLVVAGVGAYLSDMYYTKTKSLGYIPVISLAAAGMAFSCLKYLSSKGDVYAGSPKIIEEVFNIYSNVRHSTEMLKQEEVEQAIEAITATEVHIAPQEEVSVEITDAAEVGADIAKTYAPAASDLSASSEPVVSAPMKNNAAAAEPEVSKLDFDDQVDKGSCDAFNNSAHQIYDENYDRSQDIKVGDLSSNTPAS